VTRAQWACAVLAVLLSACGGDPPIPAMPTFTTDIEPIMLSKCVGCHGAGGTLNTDPRVTSPPFSVPPIDGFFDHYEDRADCSASPTGVCHGLAHYAVDPNGRLLWNEWIPMMPPPPLPPLTSWERDVIARWMAEVGPLP
jgi:hypothetical protein